MVVEVSYLTWTEDGFLRQVVYLGEREDKPRWAETHRQYERRPARQLDGCCYDLCRIVFAAAPSSTQPSKVQERDGAAPAASRPDA